MALAEKVARITGQIHEAFPFRNCRGMVIPLSETGKKQKQKTIKKRKNVKQKRRDAIAAFINSPEGKKALKESHDKTARYIAELQESRIVDRETLLRPFGPADGSGIWPHQRLS